MDREAKGRASVEIAKIEVQWMKKKEIELSRVNRGRMSNRRDDPEH